MTNQTQVQWALANDGRTIHQGGKVVASIIERAHAQQIVRAVNSHDDLLAALEAVEVQLDNLLIDAAQGGPEMDSWARQRVRETLDIIEPALALARGED